MKTTPPTCLTAGLLLCALTLSAQTSPRYLDYINTYAPLAVQEMYSSGIPASITLAQGLLESGAGGSTLATQANNHFGIKCHSSWTGERAFRKDDDRNKHGKLIESCFRKYDHPAESYADHSDFLTGSPRYAGLFLLKPDDYKGWARGLKKAGYATSKTYSAKLIGLIEAYDLSRYDGAGAEMLASRPPSPTLSDELAGTTAPPSGPASASTGGGYGNPALTGARIPRSGRSSSSNSRSNASAPSKSSAKASSARVAASDILLTNDVKYTYPKPGETLGDIARRTRNYSNDLVKYNEAYEYSTTAVDAGTRIYLQPKRKSFRGRTRHHRVRSGETFQAIADRYGIKTSSLRKRNRIDKTVEPRAGEEVVIRGRRKRKDKLKTMSLARSNKVAQGKALTETPSMPAPAATPAPTKPSRAAQPTVAATPTSTSYYTVQSGDSLWKISRTTGTSVAALRSLNQLRNDVIQPGQRLKSSK